MSINRKDFIKKVCTSGACICGFSSIALSHNQNENPNLNNGSQDNPVMSQEWISNLLSNLNEELNEDSKKNILKSCSVVHYNNLGMDNMLSPYIGDLDKFIAFLEEKWGWKIDYNKTTQTIIADENKNYCVCPIVNPENVTGTSALCYCSEGFAEKMFSTVTGSFASATVISSVRRGDETCKYKIVIEMAYKTG